MISFKNSTQYFLQNQFDVQVKITSYIPAVVHVINQPRKMSVLMQLTDKWLFSAKSV